MIARRIFKFIIISNLAAGYELWTCTVTCILIMNIHDAHVNHKYVYVHV